MLSSVDYVTVSWIADWLDSLVFLAIAKIYVTLASRLRKACCQECFVD